MTTTDYTTSAGAMSVGAHLVSPYAAGLFHKVIMESNPLLSLLNTRSSATVNANAVTTYVNCTINDIHCMKKVSVETILIAQTAAISFNLQNIITNSQPWTPLVEVEGYIPVQPLYALESGLLEGIPVLAGTVKDEGLVFVYDIFKESINATSYALILSTIFGAKNYVALSQYYPITSSIDNNGVIDGRYALGTIETDLTFYCPIKAIGLNNIPSYLYRFLHVSSFNNVTGVGGRNECFGKVCHGLELPYVFNNFNAGSNVHLNLTIEEKKLADYISNIWVNFISNGDPDIGLSIPAPFPRYNNYHDTILLLNEPVPTPPTDSHYRAVYCQMWNSYVTTG